MCSRVKSSGEGNTTVAVRQLLPVPEGSVHFCCAEPVQVLISSRGVVWPSGLERHLLAFGFTSSLFDLWVQVSDAVPLHGYQPTYLPPMTSRHPPSVRSVRSL